MTSASRDLYSFLKDRGLTPQPSSDTSADPEPTENPDGSKAFLDFDSENVGEKLHRSSDDQLHAASFGIVRVDDGGNVEFYNQYESELSGVSPEDAIGRNFFNQLAPCANNRIFQGRFKKGVRTGSLDEQFTYTFTYKMRPTLVEIRLYRDTQSNNWVLVRER
ncbi:PAS domain-containing protein [Longibacter sp.]|uniref:PAS domain-containing protein n=1 Tax=Longibacter sp. TaxID=2045415 RepID=UPI003EC0B84F